MLAKEYTRKNKEKMRVRKDKRRTKESWKEKVTNTRKSEAILELSQ